MHTALTVRISVATRDNTCFQSYRAIAHKWNRGNRATVDLDQSGRAVLRKLSALKGPWRPLAAAVLRRSPPLMAAVTARPDIGLERAEAPVPSWRGQAPWPRCAQSAGIPCRDHGFGIRLNWRTSCKGQWTAQRSATMPLDLFLVWAAIFGGLTFLAMAAD